MLSFPVRPFNHRLTESPRGYRPPYFDSGNPHVREDDYRRPTVFFTLWVEEFTCLLCICGKQKYLSVHRRAFKKTKESNVLVMGSRQTLISVLIRSQNMYGITEGFRKMSQSI